MPSIGRVTRWRRAADVAVSAILPGSISAERQLTCGCQAADGPCRRGRRPVGSRSTSRAWDRGVVACESTAPFEPFVERLERRLRPRSCRGPHPVLDAAVAQLEEFLDGRRRAFDLPIDLSDRPAWDQAVLAAVCDVPWGAVASYGQIARAVDRPGRRVRPAGRSAAARSGSSSRATGSSPADGSLGGYGVDGFGSRHRHLRLKRSCCCARASTSPCRARDRRPQRGGSRLDSGSGSDLNRPKSNAAGNQFRPAQSSNSGLPIRSR